MSISSEDKIKSIDAMLSFLTWKEALKYKEFQDTNSEISSYEEVKSEVQAHKLKESSARVLSEMKFLYPKEFASSKESSFLQDSLNSFFKIKSEETESEETEIDDKILGAIKEKAEKLSAFSQIQITEFKQIFYDDNLKNLIRAEKAINIFAEFNKNLEEYSKASSRLKSFSFNDHSFVNESFQKQCFEDLEHTLEVIKILDNPLFNLEAILNIKKDGINKEFLKLYNEEFKEKNKEDLVNFPDRAGDCFVNQYKEKIADESSKDQLEPIIKELIKVGVELKNFTSSQEKNSRNILSQFQVSILSASATLSSLACAGIVSIQNLCAVESSHDNESKSDVEPRKSVISSSLDRLQKSLETEKTL